MFVWIFYNIFIENISGKNGQTKNEISHFQLKNGETCNCNEITLCFY